MNIVGVGVMVASLILAAWWITRRPKEPVGPVLKLSALAVLAGIALVVQDRLIEVTVRGVGTIRAAASQAKTDAAVIAQIRERIEGQSATIDAVAKQASEAKKITAELAEKSEAADKKLKAMDDTQQKATRLLADVQETANFTGVVQAALNDDREAFDKLWALGSNKKSPFQARALQALNAVLEQHAPAIVMMGFTVPWKEGVDPKKFGIADLRKAYGEAPVQGRPALIEYVWKRDDLPKHDRLQFLIDVIAKDSSLKAVEYAGRYVETEAKLNMKPLAVPAYLNWWSTTGHKLP